MSAKHTNPSKPRIDKDKNRVWARAPYNFVPLPERMVLARTPLDQDQYHLEEGLTGWIDCELETCSPTYIRGLLTELQFKEQGRKKPDALEVDEKLERSAFFGTRTAEGELHPVIPGSTLRGMIRALVEVAGYGRVRWVGKEPTFTFRAVAASKDDPLKEPYQRVIGNFSRNVKAGYLIRNGENWFIQPAQTPKQAGVEGVRDAFIKVDDDDIDPATLPGFLPMDDSDYRPQIHSISFKRGDRKPKRKKPHQNRPSWVVGLPKANYTHQGVLICSGNMMETGEKTERVKHVLIMSADPDTRKRLPIPDQVIKDYKAGLTSYQREMLTDWGGGEWGCLGHGKPVFYVPQNGKVTCFGHNLNFRISARLFGKDRAATPFDFIPETLQSNPAPDLADAVFGWVEEDGYGPKSDLLSEKQRAGRVFFEDAHFNGAQGNLWYQDEAIIPKVLTGPKSTTFQHYLVQDRDWQHDPDDKASLAHYGISPQETQIRGHKFYWFKGESPDIALTENKDGEKINPKEKQDHESQLTRVQPLNAGVRFKSKIHFENLRPEELGALLWALTLPGKLDKTYRHRVGMGKPLGMGGLALQPTLHMTDRQERYESLFHTLEDTDAPTVWFWQEADRDQALETYIQTFETYILNQIASDAARLAEVPRIADLLLLHEWREDNPKWQDWTRYMEIEYQGSVNEYRERPVLPDPEGVVDLFAGDTPHQRATDPNTLRQAQATASQQPQKRDKPRKNDTEPQQTSPPVRRETKVKRENRFVDNDLPPIPDVPEEASDTAKDLFAGLFGSKDDDEKK